METRSWSPTLRTYTQVQNGRSVDAALLLMSWYGFAKADDPRMMSTFDQIRSRLEAVEGRKLVFKLSAHDGIDRITEGFHERHVIDAARFERKVAGKRQRAGTAP